MTVAEILEHAKNMSPQERKELTKGLIDMIDEPVAEHRPKTGREIAAILKTMPPVEFVDEHIQDPVEWVQAQRKKRQDYLKSLWEEEL